MYQKLLLFFIAGALVVWGAFFLTKKNQQLESPYTLEPSSAYGREFPLITTEHVERNDRNPDSAAKANIPKISILSNKGSSEDINNYITRISDDVISRFFDSRKRMSALATSTSALAINTLSMDYKTELVTPQIISFTFTVTKSITESPLPDIQIILIAFDCATGRPLEKDSFFGSVTDDELSSLFLTHYDGPTSTKPLPAEIVKAIKTPHHLSVTPEHLELVLDESKPSRLLTVPLFYVTRYFKSYIKDALTSQTEMIRMSTPE